ncbi:hypothetical protein SE17_36255 [Kouleothrix aurantiaca]|uniref:DUF11 domain-containing protein n=1 Tax=Kouleothrix aurantiaca TaxID=186479 RepID=A0A0P9EWS8_9CHLR|nr:hypothetical protein SE17_36255 [Kouleothrix aurantiaca]
MQLHLNTKLKRLLVLFAAVFALALAVSPAAWASPAASTAGNAVAPAVWFNPLADKKDSCKQSTVPCKQADLSIKKSVSRVKRSDDYIFTITVKNNSKIAAEKVVVVDQLSKRFELEYVKGPGCKYGQTVTCKVGTLGAGKSVTITIRVDVEPDNFKGKISNTASVSASTKDPNTKNNSSTVTVTYKRDT